MKVYDQTGRCVPNVIDTILTTETADGGNYQVLIDDSGDVLEKGFDRGNSC